jgi:hypothetical protein
VNPRHTSQEGKRGQEASVEERENWKARDYSEIWAQWRGLDSYCLESSENVPLPCQRNRQFPYNASREDPARGLLDRHLVDEPRPRNKSQVESPSGTPRYPISKKM